MTLVRELSDPAMEIVERLADAAPGLLLLRYNDVRLPGQLEARLGWEPGSPRCHVLHYRADAAEGAPGSASSVVGESIRLAGEGPPPVLLLIPEYPVGGALPAAAASGFWKQLNAQREALGQLDARVLVCLDSVQEPYAAAYARDLLSWCAPKFAMLESRYASREPEAKRSTVVLERGGWSGRSSDEALLLSRSLGPLWEELVESGRLPTVTDVERMGIPLLEYALNEGRLKEAEAVDRVIAKVQLPRSEARGKWLCLRGELARLLGRFPDAEAAFGEAMQLHESLLSEMPKSLRAKRDLSVTLGEYAAFLEERGQRGDAELQLALLERNLRLMQQILDESPASGQAARDVSVSMSKLGDFLSRRGKPGDADAALGHYVRCLEVRERSWAANPESGQAARDVSVVLNRLGDFLAQRGKPGDAEAAFGHYSRSVELSERLLAANPESGQAARDVSVSLSKLGDFLARRGKLGDAEVALQQYARSLELRERLLGVNPESGEAARDVSVILSKLGDFLARRGKQGDAEAALGHYERSLGVAEGLLGANPESGQAARDVSVSMNKLGDFLAERGKPGDAEAALGYYVRSLEVAERLWAANPESGQAARDVSVNLSKLGDYLYRRGKPGDGEAALGHYARSLEVDERLLAANPESGQAARDVSVSLSKLGDFLARRGKLGDADVALGHYARSLEIDECVWAANPESGEAARDVSVSLIKMGDFLSKRGKPGDAGAALRHYEQSLEVAEHLAAANPESAEAARDVSVNLIKLGDFLAGQGRSGDAEETLGYYGRSLEVSKRLLGANPESGQAARDVSVSLERLGDFLSGRGNPGDAEAAEGHYERSLEVDERLLAANPESAQAAWDVMVSLERMAAIRGAQAGGEMEALGLQRRALGIALELWERNAPSWYYGRTAAMTCVLASERALAVGETEVAEECLSGCYRILDELVRTGVELDPEMKTLHAGLKPRFGG